MHPRTKILGAVGIGAVAGLAALAARADDADRSGPRGVTAELALRNADIAFYEQRVARDPHGAANLAQLAGLYLQRARETADYADFRRAETAARRSVGLRAARNGKAQLVLASSLLAQHRFAEARIEAARLVEANPAQASYRALLGEILLELGSYDAAAVEFDRLRRDWASLAVAPRLARWAEIRGRPQEARRLLLAAQDSAGRRSDLPREQVAWFHLRVADLELRHGALRAAERAVGKGLEVEPTDPRLWALRARIAAARGRWDRVTEYGKLAVARAPDVATLGLLGDAYEALGDTVRAEQYWSAAERMGIDQPEPYNRQWTLFLLDHGRRLEAVRALLEGEIAGRPDVYGWDQLSWARYLTGDVAGASDAMRHALRMGTEDAMLYYHAGVIDRSAGRIARATDRLRRALRINPHFHPRFAPQARRILAGPR